MNNPFKEIQGNESLPEDHREKVLGDIDKTKLFLDLANFFLTEHPKVILTLFDNTKNN